MATLVRLISPATGELMAEQPQEQKVTLEQLVVSTLAMTDALSKLLITKGIITDEELKDFLL